MGRENGKDPAWQHKPRLLPADAGDWCQTSGDSPNLSPPAAVAPSPIKLVLTAKRLLIRQPELPHSAASQAVTAADKEKFPAC